MRFLLFAALFICFFPNLVYAAEVKEINTPANFKVWHIEDHTLPIVSMTFSFRNVGSAYDPLGKEGLATLAAGMMNEGAGDMDGITYRNLLQKKAIQLSFMSYRDHFTITLKTLSKNLPDALSLLSIALREPLFDDESITTVRSQILAIIEKKQESPESLAQEKWLKIAFAGHPYSKPTLGEKQTLLRISRKDLFEYVSNAFTKTNIVISAAGDITDNEISGLIDKNFSSLPKKPSWKRKIRDTKGNFSARKSGYIPFDIPQAYAVFGMPAVKRKDPDFFTAFLLNYILGGGGFESMLMREIREKRGLAYSVDTSLETLNHAAFFEGHLATRKEKISESLSLVKEVMGNLQKRGIRESELAQAKRYLIGSFAINLDSNEKLSSFLNIMQLDELGIDYLDKRKGYIEAVTKDDVDRVAKKLLNPDNVLTVVVGVEQNPFTP